MTRLVLSLCDHTGSWAAPYRAAGYDVLLWDIARGHDVRLLESGRLPRVHGVLAAPPCTHFAASGARWWADKGDAALLDGLAVVDACLRVITTCRPTWWALENPVGRLSRYLGPPRYVFQPWHHGDPWTKRTNVWGEFARPARRPVPPVMGSVAYRAGESLDRIRLRAVTPPGFAAAFAAANP